MASPETARVVTESDELSFLHEPDHLASFVRTALQTTLLSEAPGVTLAKMDKKDKMAIMDILGYSDAMANMGKILAVKKT